MYVIQHKVVQKKHDKVKYSGLNDILILSSFDCDWKMVEPFVGSKTVIQALLKAKILLARTFIAKLDSSAML